MAEKTTDVATRDEQRLARRPPAGVGSPFRMLERFADEMDRVFDDFGFGRSWLSPRRRASSSSALLGAGTEIWMPDIEIYQRDNEFVVRADLPGMKKDDVRLDITDEDITISGERRLERENEQGGVYRSERTYGSFLRTIPLPQGAMIDQAKATFTNGVLEITMPSPPEQTRARRLEIKEGAEGKK
jgi:HSP20 family protein